MFSVSGFGWSFGLLSSPAQNLSGLQLLIDLSLVVYLATNSDASQHHKVILKLQMNSRLLLNIRTASCETWNMSV